VRAAQRERQGHPSFRCASIAREGKGVPVAPLTARAVPVERPGMVGTRAKRQTRAVPECDGQVDGIEHKMARGQGV
jgi:hypothetical protein